MGPGFLAAYDSKISNADFDVLAAYSRGTTDGDVGVAHPNRGAVSPFHNAVLRSTEDLPAGSEIFLNYAFPGPDDDDDEETDGESELVNEDYVKIDETIEEMLGFFNKHDENLDSEAKQQIYRFLTEDFMNAAVGEGKSHKVTELFPSTPDDLRKVKEAGGIKHYSQGKSSRQHKLDWLEINGLCMDNIRPGTSTISNAGRGAFATRTIRNGGMVAPVPLLHISDKVALNMYNLDEEEEDAVGEQLLMNYVYSHPETSMAFLPLGAYVGLINHSSDKTNAKLQWSNHSFKNSKEWFQLKPYDLLEEDEYYTVGLMMEVAATRDIEEGEEIFIDYGEEWADGKSFSDMQKGIFSLRAKDKYRIDLLSLYCSQNYSLGRTQRGMARNVEEW